MVVILLPNICTVHNPGRTIQPRPPASPGRRTNDLGLVFGNNVFGQWVCIKNPILLLMCSLHMYHRSIHSSSFAKYVQWDDINRHLLLYLGNWLNIVDDTNVEVKIRPWKLLRGSIKAQKDPKTLALSWIFIFCKELFVLAFLKRNNYWQIESFNTSGNTIFCLV